MISNSGLGAAAEHLRSRVEEHCQPEFYDSLRRVVTVSMGVVALAPEIFSLEASDKRMYRPNAPSRTRSSLDRPSRSRPLRCYHRGR